MTSLKILWTRAREIRQEDGLIKLFRSISLFIISPIYIRNSFYLYEYHVKNRLSPNEIIRKPVTNDIVFKIVTSNQDADKLELEHYKFRSYHTDFNNGLTTYSRWLDKGAIAFCTFARNDFAAITWVISSRYSQDRIGAPPLKVDYADHEAFSRGAWVNPKYRNQGLYLFTKINRDQYLTNVGIRLLRTTIHTSNKMGLVLQRKFESREYGKAQLTRILFWRLWRETSDNRSI
jgi:hypothetical protein